MSRAQKVAVMLHPAQPIWMARF